MLLALPGLIGFMRASSRRTMSGMLGHVVADNGAAFTDIDVATGASVRVRGTGAQLLEMPLDDRSAAEVQIPLIVAMGATHRDPARFRDARRPASAASRGRR